MGDNTKIEWCDHTFNPWTGCTKVSPGCLHCYAEGWSKRSGIVKWGKGQPRRRTSVANWRKPVKWDLEAANAQRWHCRKCGRTMADQDCSLCEHDQDVIEVQSRPRVFCASLADWLDDEVPIEWLADLLELIHDTPSLDWLLLTKRPENWAVRLNFASLEMIGRNSPSSDSWAEKWCNGRPPDNVWIGTTVEDQKRADERIPKLLGIPAAVRFLSCEPLLESIQFKDVPGFNKLSSENLEAIRRLWVITGGESGPGCRPFDPEWARSLRDQCSAAGVPFFMKQMGGTRKPFPEIPADLMIREFPKP